MIEIKRGTRRRRGRKEDRERQQSRRQKRRKRSIESNEEEHLLAEAGSISFLSLLISSPSFSFLLHLMHFNFGKAKPSSLFYPLYLHSFLLTPLSLFNKHVLRVSLFFSLF